MADLKRTSIDQWTHKQTAVLASICLLAGLIGGWSIRAWSRQAGSASLSIDSTQDASRGGPANLKQMADAQAKPLLEKLKSDPGNPDLLVSLGNSYYDAQQYPIAVDYYRRALQARPNDAAVRTDLGTADWYLGNADAAIAEFNQALIDSPNNPNTLFNRGLVRLKGKMDSVGAVADWQRLLAANPTYGEREKVEQMLAEVKRQALPAAGVGR